MGDDTSDDDRPLNSDELGTKGESTFETFCADARLICNKATRDRSGWDYIVEFPINHEQPGDLDKRENPASCLFQQKTLWHDNDQIKFRLSSLERLAKDSRPSFVYALKIGPDLTPSQAYLIEMRGDVLAKVLKKLRSEQAAGQFAVNKARFSVNASSVGKAIDPTGAALREALEAAIGPDPAAYAREKQEELRTLGYEALPREMKLTFSVKDEDELFDVLLGRGDKVAVSDVRTFETRFGIKLETQDLPNLGAVKFQGFPIDTCQVIVRRSKFADPATFKGSVYMPPRAAMVDAMRITTDMFDLVYKEKQLRLSTNEISGDLPLLAPSAWHNFFLFVDALAAGGGTLEIRPGSPIRRALKLPLPQVLITVDTDRLAVDLEAADRLMSLLRIAGVNDEPILSYAQLTSQAPYVASAHAILAGEDDLTPLRFTLPGDLTPQLGTELRGLHVNYVRFDDSMLVWSAHVTVQRSEDEDAIAFTSTRLEFDDIQLMTPDAYKTYIDGLREPGDVEFVMSREETENEPDSGAEDERSQAAHG